eukprot:6457623-Amphidinium_carterae.1
MGVVVIVVGPTVSCAQDDLLAKISLGFDDVYPDGFDGTLELLGPNGQVLWSRCMISVMLVLTPWAYDEPNSSPFVSACRIIC